MQKLCTRCGSEMIVMESKHLLKTRTIWVCRSCDGAKNPIGIVSNDSMFDEVETWKRFLHDIVTGAWLEEWMLSPRDVYVMR